MFLVLHDHFCHTRSNLGILALLEILQTCKLDHNLSIRCTWDHPPTKPRTDSIISLSSTKAWKLKFAGFLVGVSRVFEGCLEVVWKVSIRYLKGVWRLLGGCLESILKVFGRSIKSGLIKLGQVKSGQVKSGSGQVKSGQDKSDRSSWNISSQDISSQDR